VDGYTRQIQCLSCSHTRSFVHHAETSNVPISQAEALALPPRSVLTCGRCGSTSLIRVWGESIPDATRGYLGRRRRRAAAPAPEKMSTGKHGLGN
jgi:hypothetical protein